MKTIFTIAILIFFIICIPASGTEDSTDTRYPFLEFLHDYITIKYEGLVFEEYLYVSVKQQKMYLISGKKILGDFMISTAKNGTGNKNGSEQTPVGLHRIQQKIGHDVPLGGIFTGRSFNGNIAEIVKEAISVGSDDVTTRILWLSGQETGINKGGDKDTFERCIYIHGTSEEGLLGTPVSHGCIRMKNRDVIVLFDKVQEGMPVVILNN